MKETSEKKLIGISYTNVHVYQKSINAHILGQVSISNEQFFHPKTDEFTSKVFAPLDVKYFYRIVPKSHNEEQLRQEV